MNRVIDCLIVLAILALAVVAFTGPVSADLDERREHFARCVDLLDPNSAFLHDEIVACSGVKP